MKFKILPVNSIVEAEDEEGFYLIEDNWNDWWEYKTLYQLYYKDSAKEAEYIGGIKIGQTEMDKDQMRPNLDEEFDYLEDEFFSIGEDNYYYENLNKLGDAIRDQLLESLRDIMFDDSIYKSIKNLSVTSRSLLRDKYSSTMDVFKELAKGNSLLSNYSFEFHYKNDFNDEVNVLEFISTPNSTPPTNVQAIIGRNGVGKTRLINKLLFSIMNETSTSLIKSNIHMKHNEKIFENIMYISFSAFDGTEYIDNTKKTTKRPAYSYIGLKKKGKNKNVINKDTEDLRDELVDSIWKCRKIPSKRARLERAFSELNVDPMFSQSGFSELLEISEEEKYKIELHEQKESVKNTFREKASTLCSKFSSGHSIVLLTICRLVEEMEEKTLVLLDEPESHLHPPLLSTFVRILSNLLVNRNGLGIIATHSPVILQEIPKECAYILDRNGISMDFHRPIIETYGENINILTKEVFSYELTNSGFHASLVEVAKQYDTYEGALKYFNGKLGLEARAILKNLIRNKRKNSDAQIE